jgi:oxalate decarboxylase/phosphoglucose isomerase-like protein (cupin superfamily)
MARRDVSISMSQTARVPYTKIRAGFAVLVPAGTNHNIVNTGTAPLKLYTLYSPPIHRDGVVHATRADAEADDETFDGSTMES